MWLAVYCRRSVDPGELGVSVHVQERNGRRYAADHFPDLPVRVYVDNDLSAANPAVTRPAYQQLISDVRAGNVAALVTREQSRLTRQPTEWEALCTTLQVAGLTHVHQTHGGPVAVTEGSRLPGRIMAVVDAEYVEQVKVKVKSALLANAEDGRPHGRAGYGYQRIEVDGRPAFTPDPVTAPIAAQMVRDIAQGASLGFVAQCLNEQGVPTPRGAGEWGRATVRAIVTAPRLIGQRVHKDRVVPAQWEPIVDRATWTQAQARLGEMPPGRTKDSRRQYLLRGHVACAACRTLLISSTTLVRAERLPSYQCPHPSRRERGCGKCSILADRLEDHVAGLISDQLTNPAFLDAVNELLRDGAVDTAPIQAELEHIDADLADLAVRRGSGDLLDIEWMTLRRTFTDRRSALLGQLSHAPVQELTLERLLRAWRHGGIGRRSLIPVLAETPILVAGAFRDGRRLTVAERVNIRFHYLA